MKWIEDHREECKINDSDKCIGCLHISEAVWAWTEAKEEIEANYAELAPVHISAISALLSSWYAEGGWDGICGNHDAIGPGLHLNPQVLQWIIDNENGKGPYPAWFVDQVAEFLRVICSSTYRERTPADLWANQPDPWMTPEYYGQAAYYADTGGSKWDAFWLGIRTIG